MKKTLFLTALFISSIMGVAQAGTPIIFAAEEKPLITGSLHGGYQNNYDWHGLVPSSLLVGHNSFYGGLDLATRPTDSGLSFLTSFTVRTVNDNDNVKNHLTASNINLPWVYKNLDIEDELSLFAGLNQQIGKDWAVSVGYRLYKGGLPGLASDLQRGSDNKGLTNIDHQVEARLVWNPCDTGFYVTAGGAYSFAGAKGWLLDAGVGYKWDFNNRISAILSGTAYFSFNYWELAGKSMKGSDGYQVKLELPIKATDSFVISPFIAANFEGSNSDHASTRVASYLNASKATRQYATIVGVEARWSF